jgi:tetratricopeptide (TPR) repeat protein
VHGLRRVEGSFLNTLALIAVRLDDLASHLEMGRQQWQLFRDMGDVPAQAVSRLHLGISLLAAGEQAQSREHLEEGLRLARAADDRVMEPYGQIYLALIAVREGRPEPAMALAQAALATSLAVQNVETQITALFQIAAAERLLGRFDAAAAAFERAHAIAVENDEPMRYDAAAGIAREALARGDVEAAMQALHEVLAHLAAGGALDGTEARQRIRLTCYEVLSAVAMRALARSWRRRTRRCRSRPSALPTRRCATASCTTFPSTAASPRRGRRGRPRAWTEVAPSSRLRPNRRSASRARRRAGEPRRPRESAGRCRATRPPI